MRKMLGFVVVLSASLSAPASAQDAGSCEALLNSFDAHLSANGIPETDERVAQERTQAEQACMAGDTAAAEASLDRVIANLGLPPRSGQAKGGDTGMTEAQGQQSLGGTESVGEQGTEGVAGADQSADADQSGNQTSGSDQESGTGQGQSANESGSDDQNSDANNSGQSGASGSDTQSGSGASGSDTQSGGGTSQ
jgi:hypothetical protein